MPDIFVCWPAAGFVLLPVLFMFLKRRRPKRSHLTMAAHDCCCYCRCQSVWLVNYVGQGWPPPPPTTCLQITLLFVLPPLSHPFSLSLPLSLTDKLRPMTFFFFWSTPKTRTGPSRIAVENMINCVKALRHPVSVNLIIRPRALVEALGFNFQKLHAGIPFDLGSHCWRCSARGILNVSSPSWMLNYLTVWRLDSIEWKRTLLAWIALGGSSAFRHKFHK